MDKEQHLRIDLSGALVGHNVVVSRLRIALQQYNASLENVRHLMDEVMYEAGLKYDDLRDAGHSEERLKGKMEEIDAFNDFLYAQNNQPIPLPDIVNIKGVIAAPPIRKEPHTGMSRPTGVLPSYVE